MPIRHLATVFSDYLTTEDGGRATLIRTFQNIETRRFPAVKFPFCFLVEFESDGEAFRITLEGPPGSRVLGEGDPKPPHLLEFQQWCVSFAGELQPGVFPEPGVYSIVLWSGTEAVHRRSFGVFSAPADQAEETQP